MQYASFELYFSQARSQRYLQATGNDSQRAIHLYKSNLSIAQAFHPLLGVTEVVIRNLLDAKLQAYFGDTEWITNQKNGFMSHASLTYIDKRTGKKETNNYLKNEVRKAEKRLSKSGITITSGRIIAEQTFGFWTDLFEVHHYRLLGGRPIQIFSALPSGYGRKNVLNELHSIRKFRNRINHNEPICFLGNNIDFTYAQAVHQSILNILTWVDPELIAFVADLNSVNQLITNTSSI